MSDIPREGGSTTRPILFNGDNYSFWKARMKVFLRSIDEEVWEAVVNGWKRPTHVVNEIIVNKPKSLWTKEEKDQCNWNNKANNAIHSALTPSEFRRISNCETAKQAWDTLMITYEGTSQVKTAKLQVLVTQYEECKMDENEVFEDFYGRLIDIVNMRHNLGDTISEAQIIRKIMRSLPERFTPKIVSIEDTKEIDTMVLSEFLGSIKTFEHNHCKTSKKGKGIALKTVMESFDQDLKIDDYTEEEMALFAKNFKKFIQHRRGNDSSDFNQKNTSNSKNFQKNEKEASNFKARNSQVRCYECRGYGHISSKCANNLEKTKNKGLNVTWDDSENESNEDGENKNDDDWNFTAFISSHKDDYESNSDKFDFVFTDDELPFENKDNEDLEYDEKFRELLNDYFLKKKENLTYSQKICELEKEIKFLKQNLGESEEKLETQKFAFEEKFKNSQNICLKFEKDLESQKADFLEKLKNSQIKFLACEQARKALEGKMSGLTSELEKYKTISNQFTAGSQGLDKLLGIGQSSKDRSGLGFDKFSNAPSTSKTVFVKASKRDEAIQKEKDILKPSNFKNSSSKNFETIQKEKVIFKSSNFQKSIPKNFEKERVKTFKNHVSSQKFIPKCHHCGEMGHIRPRCRNFSKEKSNFEKIIFRKIDELTKEISKIKIGTIWKPSSKMVNKGKPVKKVWERKEVLIGNSKDTVFDASKIRILKRPGSPSKLN